MNIVIVDLKQLMQESVLAGATLGAQSLSRLIELASDGIGPTVIYVDFLHVEVATSSFLRQSVIAFRDYCRRVRPELYPAVSNMSAVVEEEFRDLLMAMNDAFMLCQLDKRKRPHGGRVLGHLDPKQRETFDAILKFGEADATKLAASGTDVGVTAWNNRLSSLVSKGLLIERREGRQKIYRPLIEGLNHGR